MSVQDLCEDALGELATLERNRVIRALLEHFEVPMRSGCSVAGCEGSSSKNCEAGSCAEHCWNFCSVAAPCRTGTALRGPR